MTIHTDTPTSTVETINGVPVTVYDGAIPTYALIGHVTGWMKRNGARTTYAELTCTCGLTGEKRIDEGPDGKGWTSYGEAGWAEHLNKLARAHVENVTRHAFQVRPVGGDRSRWADRVRVDEDGLRDAMQRAGLRFSELAAHIADVKAGHVVTAEDGTRFEVARDRSPHAMRRLPF